MNQKGFANIIILIVGVIILAGTAGYFIVNRQTQKRSAPVIERISPTEAPIGAEISIIGSGFTSTKNSLQFGTGFAYINNLVSFDSKTITFAVPESFDTCNFDESACAEFLSRPFPGQMYEVVVINANGRSNPVNFTVISGSKPISPTPTPTPGTPKQLPKGNSRGPMSNDLAMSPYIEFEASVISLSLDKSRNYYEGEQLVSTPNDAAVIRIDKIIGTGGSYNFDWASVGIKQGKNVSLDFKYTVRPTKIITLVGETTQSGDTVSHNIVPTKITFENNYFVFREDGSSETETILPGLQVGSKFKTKLWFTVGVEVERYEAIP